MHHLALPAVRRWRPSEGSSQSTCPPRVRESCRRTNPSTVRAAAVLHRKMLPTLVCITLTAAAGASCIGQDGWQRGLSTPRRMLASASIGRSVSRSTLFAVRCSSSRFPVGYEVLGDTLLSISKDTRIGDRLKLAPANHLPP